MTPAEFKCLRELMGLSTRFLSERWGVSEMSVQRWERNRTIPREFEGDVEGMVRDFLSLVRRGIDRSDGSIEAPRTDAECRGEFPSAYYRRAAALVSLRTLGEIVFSVPCDDDL